MTPSALAHAIVAHLQPSGRLLDPCRGDGAFFDAMVAYGPVDWCEIDAGRDFLEWTTPVDWIIANPPWNLFAPFLAHALTVADHVVFLATVNHWYTKHRVRLVQRAGFGYRDLLFLEWPAGWHTTGFQLGAMHVQRGWTGAQENVWLTCSSDELVRRGRLPGVTG